MNPSRLRILFSAGFIAICHSLCAEESPADTSKQKVVDILPTDITAFNYLVPNPSSSLRISTPISLLPQNIQIISASLFSDQQSFDMLEGIQRNVSGAQRVEHWDNYARINMRGAQITAFRNGLNVQMPWGPLSEDMSMVERIEFVKGPAGFMMGLGEAGGFYNIVTKKPTGREQGAVSFNMGSFSTWRTTADFDGLIGHSGKWLYRVNVMGQLKGSHREFEYNNRYSFAPVITYLINEKSIFTLEYTHQYSEMNAIGSNYAFSKRGYADLPLSFTTAEANLAPSIIHDKSLIAYFNHQLNDYWRLSAQMGMFQFNQTGQSLWPSGFASNDSFMTRGVSIWDALGLNKNAQAYLNGRWNWKNTEHRLIAGFDMSHKDYFADWNQGANLGDSTFNIYEPIYGSVPSSEIPQWDRSQNIRERGVRYTTAYQSFYAQDEVAVLNNKLRITLAGRYTVADIVNPYSGIVRHERFTPRAGLNYTVRKGVNIYALYDQSFTPNLGADWQGNNFDPQLGENKEIGLKKDWFNGKWNSTISAYTITRRNVLTPDLEHADPISGRFIFNRTNGEQKVEGVEVDVKGQLLPNLSVIINYAYTNAVITKDARPELIGNNIAGATKHLQNLWLKYTMRKGCFKGFAFSLGYQYQSGRSSWFVFDGTENALPDYLRLDGGISWHKDNINVNFIVNNLLNEYLYSGAPYFGIYYWQTEPGRNSRLSVSYSF